MSPTNRPVVQYPASPTRQVIAVPSVSSPVPLSAGSFVSPVSMVPPVTTPMPMTYSQVSQVAPVLTIPFQFGKVSNPSLTVKKPLEAGAAEAAKCGQSIHHAAKMGNIEAIRYIHRNHPHSIHTYDETGQMPLHHAVCKGHKEMVKELLKHGADIEATNHDGMKFAVLVALGVCKVPTCRVYVWVDLEDAQMAEHNFRAAQDVSKAFEDFIAKFEKLLGQRGHG
ncbi:unnamed protein product [Durusdinium trenchii]|uniref:Uncharacterized protein n=1 Tax=Durusdinium trenchii TaxID=1381693 RepID=A0ABP0NI74_9DINO